MKGSIVVCTRGAPDGGFLKAIREVTEMKHCRDSIARVSAPSGAFKPSAGIARGHMAAEILQAAAAFCKRSG